VHVKSPLSYCIILWKLQYQKEGDSTKDIKIKEVMDTWTLQMGYPVVTVRQSDNQISATQQRFLFNAHSNFTEEFTSPYGWVLFHFCDVIAIVHAMHCIYSQISFFSVCASVCLWTDWLLNDYVRNILFFTDFHHYYECGLETWLDRRLLFARQAGSGFPILQSANSKLGSF